MFRNICLKSTLRRPVLTLFLLLLVGAISFAFMARAVELVVVEKESARIESYYVASGTLGDPFGEVSAALAILDQSQYLAYHDIRRYTTATLDGVKNGNIMESGAYTYIDVGNFNTYYDMVLMSGTLIEKTYVQDVGVRAYGDGTYRGGAWMLRVAVDAVYMGYPECARAGELATLYLPLLGGEVDEAVIGGLKTGGRYVLRGRYDDNLVGRRPNGGMDYSHWSNAYLNLTLTALYTGDDAPYFIKLDSRAAFDPQTDGPLELWNEYRLADINQRLVRISTTRNMAAMANMAASAKLYHMAKGRMLTHSDELSGVPVCVIENSFAKARGLAVGDTLRLSFADFPALSYAQLVAEPTADFLDRWQEQEAERTEDDGPMTITLWHREWAHIADWSSEQAWAETPASPYIEFEIVGTFLRTTDVSYNDASLIFIPDAYLPQGLGNRGFDGVYSYQYSFVLKNAGDEAAFMAETGGQLEALGFDVQFVENNIEAFQGAMSPVRQSSAFNAGVFAVVLVLALALAVFIYLRQGRREFAILRALGVPRGRAVGQVMLPMCIVGGLGIAGGGLLAWHYALDKAAHTLAQIKLPEGLWVMVSLHPIWLAGMMGAVLALVIAFTLTGAARVAGRPVLELIQGATAQGRGRGRAPAPAPAGGLAAAAPAPSPARTRVEVAAPTGGGRPGAGAVWRHIWRHIWRAPLKSALSGAVALFFVLALGWISHAIDQSAEQVDLLYSSTPVEVAVKPGVPESGAPGATARDALGNLILQLSARSRERLETSDYVQDIYLERTLKDSALGAQPGQEGEGIILCTATDLEVFYRAGLARLAIEYAPGWDRAAFYSPPADSVPVLLPTGAVGDLGIAPGGAVYLGDKQLVVAGQYTLSGMEAGGPMRVFAPYSALSALEAGEAADIFYDDARIVLDNESARRVLVAQWEVGKILLNNDFIVFAEYNTHELDRVVGPMEKNLRLLKVLYPVTIGISAVIACGLALLLMLQAAREAAVMRVLGAPRLRVRAMLCVQQALLCVAGLALGLTALAAVQGGAWGAAPLLCAALYMASTLVGSTASSVLITRKMPLELLQVKE